MTTLLCFTAWKVRLPQHLYHEGNIDLTCQKPNVVKNGTIQCLVGHAVIVKWLSNATKTDHTTQCKWSVIV